MVKRGRGSGPRGRKVGYRSLASAKGTPGKAEGEAWLNRLRRFRAAARQAGWTEERITSVIGRGQGGVAAAEDELGVRRRATPTPAPRQPRQPPAPRYRDPKPPVYDMARENEARAFRARARGAGWSSQRIDAIIGLGLYGVRAEMRKQGW